MDKRRSILNVGVSILSRILLLTAALYVRRLLIQQIGNDINGLNSLYTSLIGMLTVAELGVGGAIIFSMYRPIIAGKRRQVAALYCLYRKLYRIIGMVILGAGLLVMPFLPLLIKDYVTVNVNVYTTFFLTLVSVVLSYVVFHNVFGKSPRAFCLKNYAYISYFACCVFVFTRLARPCGTAVAGLIVNGSLSVALSGIALGLLFVVDREFRREARALAAAIPACFGKLFKQK